MIEYRKIWESINNESEALGIVGQTARRIPSNGIFPVFLATDFHKRIRLLYIKLESEHDIIPDKLPFFRGLEITLTVSSVGEFQNQLFLKFTQSMPETENIFELVISDICSSVIKIDDAKELRSILIKVLKEWKIFFEERENKILSLEMQKGLYGELIFLKNVLFSKYSPSSALLHWTGSDRTNHDFQIGEIAVEVKTISGKQHQKFTVSSEKQLDNTGLQNLYLTLFVINMHTNNPSCSIPDLVKEITGIVQKDPVALFEFETKVAKYGYDYRQANLYNVGFSLSESRVFEITDGFPRILSKDLPLGIGDLKYSVLVASCISYEIKSDLLELI